MQFRHCPRLCRGRQRRLRQSRPPRRLPTPRCSQRQRPLQLPLQPPRPLPRRPHRVLRFQRRRRFRAGPRATTEGVRGRVPRAFLHGFAHRPEHDRRHFALCALSLHPSPRWWGRPAPLRGASCRPMRPEGGPAAATDDADTDGVGLGASEVAPPSMLAPEQRRALRVGGYGGIRMPETKNGRQLSETGLTDRAVRLRAASCALAFRAELTLRGRAPPFCRLTTHGGSARQRTDRWS